MKILSENNQNFRFKLREGRVKPKYLVALHECGHAVVSYVLNPQSVSSIILDENGINQYENAYTVINDDATRFDYEQLADTVVGLLGGKAALEISGFTDVGSSDDLATAFQIVEDMVGRLGCDGLQYYSIDSESEQTKYDRDAEIFAKMKDFYSKAKKILNENKESLQKLTQCLMLQNELSGDDIRLIMDSTRNERGSL